MPPADAEVAEFSRRADAAAELIRHGFSSRAFEETKEVCRLMDDKPAVKKHVGYDALRERLLTLAVQSWNILPKTERTERFREDNFVESSIIELRALRRASVAGVLETNAAR